MQPGAAQRLWWVPAVAGAALGGFGAFALLRVKSDSDALTGGAGTPTLSLNEAVSARADGKTFKTLGYLGVGLGAAALAGAGAMYFLGSSDLTASAAFDSHGAAIALTGRFP